jgi:hypothetical protein
VHRSPIARLPVKKGGQSGDAAVPEVKSLMLPLVVSGYQFAELLVESPNVLDASTGDLEVNPPTAPSVDEPAVPAVRARTVP